MLRLREMNIEDMAAEKVSLGMRLEGLAMLNTFGMSVEDRIKVEIDDIQTRKRLTQVNSEISSYIQAK
jgi:hypothetical protein